MKSSVFTEFLAQLRIEFGQIYALISWVWLLTIFPGKHRDIQQNQDWLKKITQAVEKVYTETAGIPLGISMTKQLVNVYSCKMGGKKASY